jgi:threonine dehydratase
MIVSHADIEQARHRISGYIRRTPILAAPIEIRGIRCNLTFKLENLQVTGSFKPRGALNRILAHPALPSAGLVAASGGNHGLAVAYAAQKLGLPCEIFLPTIAPQIKRAQLAALGAQVTIAGDVFVESLEAANARAEGIGALAVHAFDHPDVVAGQGTIAAELEEQAPELDTILVAVGGGGFIGGIATWYDARARIVAVEAEGSPTLARARQAGHPIDIATGGLAADSLGCRRIGDIGFEIAQRLVSDTVVVSEDAIRDAQRLLWNELRIVAEPGGAVALAALIDGAYTPTADEAVGILVCGGNTSLADIPA